MRDKQYPIEQCVPLGGLGTGGLEVCSDGRFRNLTLNNNRTLENRIPLAPHSFLAVRASQGRSPYVRRLQTSLTGVDAPHLLPANGLHFRGQYPQADCKVNEPGAPLETVWSAFGPVVPYDYEASALPLAFFAVHVTNTSAGPQEVSCFLNWQNTCGSSAQRTPEELPPIARETVISQADWDRMRGKGAPDNERRLSAQSGRTEVAMPREIRAGDILPNALVFGDARAVDGNEDGQYCVTTPWRESCQTSLAVWDPEDVEFTGQFWKHFAAQGDVLSGPPGGLPRAGAVCSRFALAPGESRSVSFVVSWYCPRYAVGGPDEGNYYANTYTDAKSIARIGLANSGYFHASVAAWQNRLGAAGIEAGMLRRLLRCCEVLSTNSVHTRDGDFGLFQGLHDPRVNYLRDRWFWSMGLLLFYPRMELDVLDRMSQRIVESGMQTLRISEGIEGFCGAEFVAPGAAQVEAGAQLVALAYRNFVIGGNLSSFARIAPRVQAVMAALLAQDKDLDGFPDIYHEAPGLDGAFASGFNVITAGLWMVALRAAEQVARHQRFPEAELYRKVFERAARSFDRYFWDREHGHYRLYPAPEHQRGEATPIADYCHVGQLLPIWMAAWLGLPSTFPRVRVERILETVENLNARGGQLRLWSLPGAGAEDASRAEAGTVEPGPVHTYMLVSYLCARACYLPDIDVYEAYGRLVPAPPPYGDGGLSGRHVSELALWYLVVAHPVVRLNLAEKRLEIRLDRHPRGQRKTHTLFTPNGFGTAQLEMSDAETMLCQIAFRMDIPQELTSIRLNLPAGIEDIHCRIELEEGPLTVQCSMDAAGAAEPVATLLPQGKLSTPAFTLLVRAAPPGSGPPPSKKQWIPGWFRR